MYSRNTSRILTSLILSGVLLAAPLQFASADDGPAALADEVQTFSVPILKHPGAELTSTYGVHLNALSNKRRWHGGVTIGGIPLQTELYAPAAGEIVFADYKPGYGRTVDVKLDKSGSILRLAHLHAAKVMVGQRVEPGSLIGLVGKAGRSLDPHVHIEYRRDGKRIDPESVPGLQFYSVN